MITKKPNFQALGNCLGITAGGARARFQKVQAFFEETRQSPKDGIERKAPSKNKGDQAKPKSETKKNPKKELSGVSDNESVTSLVLISDGEIEESIKIETPTKIKAEPDLVVKDEFVAI